MEKSGRGDLPRSSDRKNSRGEVLGGGTDSSTMRRVGEKPGSEHADRGRLGRRGYWHRIGRPRGEKKTTIL